MKYRKKSVVEAIQLTEDLVRAAKFDGGPEPFGLPIAGSWHSGRRVIYSAYVPIRTLEGVMRADIGDWIVRGVKGEFYPIKADIFAETYEPVELVAAIPPSEAQP